MVIMFFSGELSLCRIEYCVVVFPLPVGPVDKNIPFG